MDDYSGHQMNKKRESELTSDALDAAASSYARERSHRDSGERRRDEREDRYRDRPPRDDRERDYRSGDRERERDRDGHRDRERERDGGRRDDRGRYDRDRYERERHDRERDDHRGGGGGGRRRDDVGISAEPMGGGGGGGYGGPPPRRRGGYEDEFAAPMRGYDAPPRRGPPGGYGGGGDMYGGRGGGMGGPPGGGYGGPRGRGGPGGGGGRRPSLPREPTPEGTVPLDERVIDFTLWDVRPPQFSGISGMEAKMTGMFSYGPGRIPPPAHLGLPDTLLKGSFTPGLVGLITPARQAKRVYIGNVTSAMAEKDLKAFFEKLMRERSLASEKPGNVVELVQLNHEKLYGFVEFRTPAEATAALSLDGIEYQNEELSLKRPKEYLGIDPALGAGEQSDSPHKLFIGGLPTHLNEDQVQELLKSFGELKSFNLVKEPIDGVLVSKGFAFCEYVDAENVTDLAIQGLNNFQLGDKALVVQRADTGKGNGDAPGGLPGTTNFLKNLKNILADAGTESQEITSRCMVMLNMVTPEELQDDEEFQDIMEDIGEETGKYGTVEGIRIPRPVAKKQKKGWGAETISATEADQNRKTDEAAGVGRVYVMYTDVAGAKSAMDALGGRQFGGRTILVASVSEDEFIGNKPPPLPALPPPPPVEAPRAIMPPQPPPPRPVDIDTAAEDALRDIMG